MGDMDGIVSPSKFICRSPKFPCDYIGDRALNEVIGVKL